MPELTTHYSEFVATVGGSEVRRALCAVVACHKDPKGPITVNAAYVTCSTCRDILERRLTNCQDRPAMVEAPQSGGIA